MRIVIDLQGAQTASRYRGIGRYSLSLAQAIVRNRGDHEIIIALSDLFPDTNESIRTAFDDLLPQENIRVWNAPGPVREGVPENTWRREAAELIREAFLASLQPDVVHISSLFEGYLDDAVTSIGRFDQTTPVSVSLYDLIPLLNPDHYLKSNPGLEQYYLRKIDNLRRSSLLLAISEYSRQEGIDNLGLHPASIVNVSTAAEAHFQPLTFSESQAQVLRDKFNLSRPFLLYCGGADERKNLPSLIRAYARLSVELRNTHQLVFAGNIHEDGIYQLQKVAKATGLRSEELVFTGYATDDELVQLYNLCKMYVFPSWHEGFGLPALEAMSCGTPVIAANTSSLPEVIGNADALFDPFSVEAISRKIGDVLTNDGFRQSLQDKGLVQATRFSWDKSAKAAIYAFENLIEKQGSPNGRSLATHVLVNQIAKNIPPDLSEESLINLASSIGRNHPQAGLRQLFVDISELSKHDAASGVQRVTRSILMELLKNPPVGYRVEPVYATTQSNGYYYARKFTARLLGQSDTTVADDPLTPMVGDVFLGLDLQHHVVIAHADYFEKLKRQNVELYFVVYDLLPITFSKYFAEEHSALHAQWLEVISRFDGLACISETVVLEAEEWLGKHFPNRKDHLEITFFHMGANIKSSAPSKGLSKDYLRVQSFLQGANNFLMVGTLEPRKGHRQALLAFEELWEKGVQANLVIVGKQGWMLDDLIEKIQNHPQLDKKLFWLNGISDEYLEKIYAVSTCLIAASEGEGFGLPLVEAAQHKLPIIARDIPVFREVVGQHAYYFSGEEASDLARSIEEWVSLYQEQKHPASDNVPWFTWQQSTDDLIDIILGGEDRRPVKQLLVDVSELVQRDARTGIQRVVRSLLKEILSNPPKGWRVEPVYATTEQGYRYARRFTLNFLNCPADTLSDEPVEYRTGDIFLGLDLQPQVIPIQQAFYQQLRRHGVRVYFMVHDLLAVRHPKWFLPGGAEGYTSWLKTITQADGAICVSKATADDLLLWIDENRISRTRPFHISVSHNGADISNSVPSYGMPDDVDTMLKALRKHTGFLMIGTIEPRKGHTQTLAAFEQLWAKGVEASLVIVGKQGWIADTLVKKMRNHPELGKRLFWLAGISDEYLEKIFAASSCLILASEGEGFGLPLIEAAHHELPIIARDIPVFREVAGEYAFYFDGLAPDNLAVSIQKWLALYESNQHPSSESMAWLTWSESATQLLATLGITSSETSEELKN